MMITSICHLAIHLAHPRFSVFVSVAYNSGGSSPISCPDLVVYASDRKLLEQIDLCVPYNSSKLETLTF